jgi:hypothetical protein
VDFMGKISGRLTSDDFHVKINWYFKNKSNIAGGKDGRGEK